MRPDGKFTSRYLDLPKSTPLYEFGYGLSYTTFTVSNLNLSSTTMSANGHITATVDVRTPARGPATTWCSSTSTTRSRASPAGTPPARLPARHARPRPEADPEFTLASSDVGFYDNTGRFVVEPGAIDVFANDRSSGGEQATFRVTAR